MKRRLLIICTIASLTAPLFADDGFDFDDLEEIEKVEKQEQLQIKNKKSKEEKRQRATQRQQSSSGGSSSSVYIVDWGYDFSGGDKLWGRNGVKLSNGRKIYMWLNKQSYGLKCYNLSIQGSFYGNASLCEDSIKPYSYWTASCEGSGGQFQVKGNQVDVVKAIVARCGGY